MCVCVCARAHPWVGVGMGVSLLTPQLCVLPTPGRQVSLCSLSPLIIPAQEISCSRHEGHAGDPLLPGPLLPGHHLLSPSPPSLPLLPITLLPLPLPSPSLPHSLTHSPPPPLSLPPLQDYTAMLVALLSWKQSSHVIKLISQWLSAGLGGCGQGGGASTEDEAEHQKVKGKVSVLQLLVCMLHSLPLALREEAAVGNGCHCVDMSSL